MPAGANRSSVPWLRRTSHPVEYHVSSARANDGRGSEIEPSLLMPCLCQRSRNARAAVLSRRLVQ